MRLNLGCGTRKVPEWVNVDKSASCEPDVLHDLETFPWPWEDSSVEEIALVHVLEHFGCSEETYKRIWQEIYRILKPGAAVFVQCPHPRCDDFLNDPTHVRTVTPTQFTLFSQTFNKECEEKGFANTQLGKYWGIDLAVERVDYTPTDLYLERNPAKAQDMPWLLKQSMEKLNQIKQFTVILRAVK